MTNANLDYFADLIRRKPIRTALIAGAFFGFMIATAGVAIWPPFTKLASPLICKEGVRLESEHFSMVNGESGVNRHFYCEDTPGVRKPVNLRSMVITGLVYSGILSMIFGGIFLVGRRSG
jgi:hypothetical protein